jgi:16S rRNA (adenine1518-N6/adenine1519-N6)-dimethyltransferase
MKNIVAKKSLGQNFLHSMPIVEKIVDVSGILPGDIVVEVGPGEGVLTNALLNAGAHVIAIEKDARCIPLLADRFADAINDRHLILIEGDVLEKNITTELFAILSEIPSYKVVANIPYYITGMLFRYFLEEHRQPSQLTFLVQKEVAEQIIAKDAKGSILSLSIKIFGDPHYVGKVGKECFRPEPKVDSAILTIKNINDARLGTVSRVQFFRVVKAGFRARRKMLVGNLVDGLSADKASVLALFEKLQINPKIRGEDLSIEQWVQLAELLP